MNWFILALLAPLAWSIANYLDKFLLSNSGGEGEGGSGGLMILSSFVSLIAAGCVLLKFGAAGVTLDSQSVGVLILSGMFEALYILFYFWALEIESTATVISLFQFAPIMGLLFGYLMLGETPTSTQFIAVVVILMGTLLIIKKKGERLSFSGHVLLFMIIATTFVGIYNTLFKIVGENIPFWAAMFWQYLGIGMVGFLLFFGVAPYRKQTIDMVTKKSSRSLGLTAAAEIMNILAVMATNAAILLAPVALVLSVSSIQPVFVMIEAYIIMVFFPKLLDPCDKPKFMLQYILGILLVCVG